MSARYDYYLRTDCWKLRSQACLIRANFICQVQKRCKGGKATQSHHMNGSYSRLGNERPSDLLACCAACHRWLHNIPEPKLKAVNDNQLQLPLEVVAR